MIQKIIRFFRGYVKIKVEGYSPERFLNLCSYHQIYMWGLNPCGNAYEMYVNLKGFRKLRPIVRKTHIRVTLIQRCGLPFFIQKYRKRKLFFIGFVSCVYLLYFYSCFIWDIHFEGNEKWTDETLLEFLEKQDISPYMKKSKIDCAQIVRDIRKEYDDIVWVSASIDGSRLKIQVKENEDTFQEVQKEETPNDLIASQDGVITSIITRAGVPQVHVGDTVQKGDLLVSGRVDVLNDAGEVIDYQYRQADADIYADTQMDYEDTISTYYLEKAYEKSKCFQFYVRLGKWNLRIGGLRNTYSESDVYTEEHRVKLGENFYLPVSYGWKVVNSYVSEKKRCTKNALQIELSENFEQFSKELQEKGIQIRGNSVKIHISQNSASAKGDIFLNQEIAEKADTEILTIERNSEDESLRTDD